MTNFSSRKLFCPVCESGAHPRPLVDNQRSLWLPAGAKASRGFTAGFGTAGGYGIRQRSGGASFARICE